MIFCDAFLAINKGDVRDTEIESIMDCIVDSLFSVFVTLGESVGSLSCLCCLDKVTVKSIN